MASNGIRDRVAIVGMGCTSFGERWDKSVSDLLVDATKDATASAGIDLKDIDAFWLGTLFSGQSGLTLSRRRNSRHFGEMGLALHSGAVATDPSRSSSLAPYCDTDVTVL